MLKKIKKWFFCDHKWTEPNIKYSASLDVWRGQLICEHCLATTEKDFDNKKHLLFWIRKKTGDDEKGSNVLFLDCESAHPGAETVVYLAATPRNGQRPNVLLIDGDPEESKLSSLLGLDGHRGLADAARGFELDCLIHPLELSRTHFLPAGRDGTSLPEEAVRNIVQQLSQVFDFVFISGGKPENKLIPTLAQECRESFLVVRLGSSHRSSAVNTLSLLETAGVQPTGCIIANIQADHTTY